MSNNKQKELIKELFLDYEKLLDTHAHNYICPECGWVSALDDAVCRICPYRFRCSVTNCPECCGCVQKQD